MKKKKPSIFRLISGILVFLLIVTVFTSCGNSSGIKNGTYMGDDGSSVEIKGNSIKFLGGPIEVSGKFRIDGNIMYVEAEYNGEKHDVDLKFTKYSDITFSIDEVTYTKQ